MLGATIIILGALKCEGFYIGLKAAGAEPAITSTVDIIERVGIIGLTICKHEEWMVIGSDK